MSLTENNMIPGSSPPFVDLIEYADWPDFVEHIDEARKHLMNGCVVRFPEIHAEVDFVRRVLHNRWKQRPIVKRAYIKHRGWFTIVRFEFWRDRHEVEKV